MNCSHCGARNIGDVAACPYCKTATRKVRNQKAIGDVELAAIGEGCVTSFMGSLGLGAILFIVVLLITASSGTQSLVNTMPLLRIVLFCAGGALDILVGFVTARRTSHAKKLHALIVAVLLILVSLVGLIVSMRGDNSNLALAVLRCFLILPLVLYGANLEEKNS